MNCLAASVDGELADKVTKTPWVVLGDEELVNTFTTVSAMKKEVDRTLWGYKQHFELRVKEIEARFKNHATVDQTNQISRWLEEIEGILENNVKPILERQGKQLVSVTEDQKSGDKKTSYSPFLALQYRLATSVAAGPETAVADIREMLFTAVVINESNPEIRECAELAIQKLQGVGGCGEVGRISTGREP